jgi:hypothetical protein
MRIDLYTKTILTLIALLLGVVALKPIFRPDTVAAQSDLSGVQFSGSGGELWAVDTRSGHVWVYDVKSGQVLVKRNIVKIGMSLFHDATEDAKVK